MHKIECVTFAMHLGLPEEANNKHKFINGVNPFLSACSRIISESESCPPVDYCTLVSYFVLKTSFLIPGRAVKGLKAYNQFASG